jgi:hypothetical protein
MNPLDIIERYRRYRVIAAEYQTQALAGISHETLLHIGREIGIVLWDEDTGQDKVFFGPDDPEWQLVYDLALYTKKPRRERGLVSRKERRERGIDRYARTVRPAPGSEKVRVLDALRAAQFSIFEIGERHPVAGVMLKDVAREREVWLMDEEVPFHGQPGHMFATRLFWPDEFGMICFTVVPMSADTLEQTFFYMTEPLKDDPAELMETVGFVTTLYDVAIDTGMLELLFPDAEPEEPDGPEE